MRHLLPPLILLWTTLTLPLLGACSVGSPGPATANSAAAVHAEEVREIERLAAEVDDLAHQLTVQVDESRRAVQEGRSTPSAEIPLMTALADQLSERNAALQAAVSALEQRVVASAQADRDSTPQSEPSTP